MLKPKCIIKDDNGCIASLGHSAEGYMTPCCWIDAMFDLRGVSQDIFYQEKFLISNNESIKDITQSQEWVDFYTMLQDDSQEKPKLCLHKCSSNSKKQKDFRWLMPLEPNTP